MIATAVLTFIATDGSISARLWQATQATLGLIGIWTIILVLYYRGSVPRVLLSEAERYLPHARRQLVGGAPSDTPSLYAWTTDAGDALFLNVYNAGPCDAYVMATVNIDGLAHFGDQARENEYRAGEKSVRWDKTKANRIFIPSNGEERAVLCWLRQNDIGNLRWHFQWTIDGEHVSDIQDTAYTRAHENTEFAKLKPWTVFGRITSDPGSFEGPQQYRIDIGYFGPKGPPPQHTPWGKMTYILHIGPGGAGLSTEQIAKSNARTRAWMKNLDAEEKLKMATEALSKKPDATS